MSDQVDESNQGSLQGRYASLTAVSMIITPLSMTWILSQFSNRNSEIYFPGAPYRLSSTVNHLYLCFFISTPKKFALTLRIDEIDLNVIN